MLLTCTSRPKAAGKALKRTGTWSVSISCRATPGRRSSLIEMTFTVEEKCCDERAWSHKHVDAEDVFLLWAWTSFSNIMYRRLSSSFRLQEDLVFLLRHTRHTPALVLSLPSVCSDETHSSTYTPVDTLSWSHRMWHMSCKHPQEAICLYVGRRIFIPSQALRRVLRLNTQLCFYVCVCELMFVRQQQKMNLRETTERKCVVWYLSWGISTSTSLHCRWRDGVQESRLGFLSL